MNEKLVTVELTPVEVDHLFTVMRDARNDGSYYGPRVQYIRRHDRIMEKLEAAAERWMFK